MSAANTTERIATYKDVALLAMKHASTLGESKNKLAANFEVDHDEFKSTSDAEAFARDLEDLGPTFVKIGQLLSTRVDLMPGSYVKALERLQDDTEPVGFASIREKIEEELGAKVDQIFDEFEETPMASASIGQVHRAVLRDGKTEVAVKIRKPGVRKKMLKELDAIMNVASFLQEHTEFGKTYEIELIANQFRRSILDELNYEKESLNLKRLADSQADEPLIVVPRPFEDFCSPGVLTMEYISGHKITDLSGVVLNELDGEGIAESIFRSYLHQVMLDGFFHADPHPGNILLTQDRRIAMIDLGMVGTVPDDLRDSLIKLLGSVAEGRSEDAATAARLMGTPKATFDREEFDNEIKRLVDDRAHTTVNDLKIGSLVMEVTDICGRNGLRIPDAVFMLGKMLLNLDRIGQTLAPEFDPDASIRRNMADLARKRLNDHFSLGNVVNYLTDMKELFSQTPARLNAVLDKVSENKIELSVDAIDEENLLKGFHRVANRITVGLILAALIVGASMLMNIESNFTILGYPGLAMIFFLIAAVGGLALVGRILLGSESE